VTTAGASRKNSQLVAMLLVGTVMIVNSYKKKKQTSHIEKGALRQSSNVNFNKELPQILLA
jgi:hypothetical protein